MKIFLIVVSIVVVIAFFLNQSLKREEETKEILRKRNNGEYDLEKSIHLLDEQLEENGQELERALMSNDDDKIDKYLKRDQRLASDKERLVSELKKLRFKL